MVIPLDVMLDRRKVKSRDPGRDLPIPGVSAGRPVDPWARGGV